MSNTKANPGDTVKLTLSLKTDAIVNSIAVSDIVYDSEVLEFVGFADYEWLEDICLLPPSFNSEKGYILIALSEAMEFNGDICTLEFKVKETATDCTVSVSAKPVVKYNSDVLESEKFTGEIDVYTYLKGDIDGDEDVDIDDAVYLFGISMLPEYFPTDYPGNMDFVQDGQIDIQDAILLFNYSMLPNICPIP